MYESDLRAGEAARRPGEPLLCRGRALRWRRLGSNARLPSACRCQQVQRACALVGATQADRVRRGMQKEVAVQRNGSSGLKGRTASWSLRCVVTARGGGVPAARCLPLRTRCPMVPRSRACRPAPLKQEGGGGCRRLQQGRFQQHLDAPPACAARFTPQLGQSCLLDSSSARACTRFACPLLCMQQPAPTCFVAGGALNLQQHHLVTPLPQHRPRHVQRHLGAVARAGGAARHHARHIG